MEYPTDKCLSSVLCRCVHCFSNVHIQGCFLFPLQWALYREVNTIQSESSGGWCYLSCATGRVLSCLQGQQLDSLIARGPQRTRPHKDGEPGVRWKSWRSIKHQVFIQRPVKCSLTPHSQTQNNWGRENNKLEQIIPEKKTKKKTQPLEHNLWNTITSQ